LVLGVLNVSLYQSFIQLIVSVIIISFQLYWVFKKGRFLKSHFDTDVEQK
jgi:hypothetical protein